MERWPRRWQPPREQLDVQPDYYQEFEENNPLPIEGIKIKHINLKHESEKINERLQKLKK